MTHLTQIEQLASTLTREELLQAIRYLLSRLEENPLDSAHEDTELDATPAMWKELLEQIEAHERGELKLIPKDEFLENLRNRLEL